MRLARYMSVTLVKLALVATLILAFIAEVLDLVDNAGDIMDAGEGVGGILRYAGLRMPILLVHAMPLGALVGALLTLALLARNSEISAMRSAGRGMFNLFMAMLPGAFVLVVLHSTLIDVVAPRAQAKLAIQITQRVEAKQAKQDGVRDLKTTRLRVGEDIVTFDRVSDKGRRLKNVRIYDRGADKIVTARTVAQEARWRDDKWTLTGAEKVSWAKDTMNQKTVADGVWNTTMTPDDVLGALSPESRISLDSARKVLAGEQTPNAPLPFYQTLVERVYAMPLGLIVMVLLAMPAALVNWRDVRSSRHMAFALVAGLGFLLTDGVLTTLGLTGVVAPVFGAWAGVVAFAVIGILRVMQIDAGWSTRRVERRARKRLAEAGA